MVIYFSDWLFTFRSGKWRHYRDMLGRTFLPSYRSRCREVLAMLGQKPYSGWVQWAQKEGLREWAASRGLAAQWAVEEIIADVIDPPDDD